MNRQNEDTALKETLQVDYEQLVGQVWEALEEWRTAQNRFDLAVDHDQVDYAIYAWRAAEKRYQMLLRMAKLKYEQILQEGVAVKEVFK